MPITGFKIFPGYINENLEGDIAIAKMAKPVFQPTYPVLNDLPLTTDELEERDLYGKAGGYGRDQKYLYVADVLLDSKDPESSGEPPFSLVISYDGELEGGDSGSALFEEREGKPPLLLGLCSHSLWLWERYLPAYQQVYGFYYGI